MSWEHRHCIIPHIPSSFDKVFLKNIVTYTGSSITKYFFHTCNLQRSNEHVPNTKQVTTYLETKRKTVQMVSIDCYEHNNTCSFAPHFHINSLSWPGNESTYHVSGEWRTDHCESHHRTWLLVSSMLYPDLHSENRSP